MDWFRRNWPDLALGVALVAVVALIVVTLLSGGSLASLVLTVGFYRHGGWRKGRLVPPLRPLEAEERALADMQATGKARPIG